MDNRSNNLKEGLIKFLTIAGDLMALNLLWFVCSLPIITIGPSTCALFNVTLKLADDQSFPVLKTFFKAFKENFKQSLAVGAFSIVVIVALYFDVNFVLASEGTIQTVYIIVSAILYTMLLSTISYLNALICRYNNTLKGHIINTLKLAFVNPIRTILMWAILSLPVLIILFIQPIIILYLGWFFILFLVSLPVYMCSTILVKIFRKFENAEGK
ncbi:MAG: YesL family protein [Erysipelotrichaceae bacterium]|nr:YesL family protein [Erysipelotrichaceae bacterium]